MNTEVLIPGLESAQAKIRMIDERQKVWQSLPVKTRIIKIAALRKIISRRSDEIANAVSGECGRPQIESLSQEVLPVLEMLKYCESKFPSWLKSKKIRYIRPGFWRKKNIIVKQPIGTAGIITPANFPFSLGMMSAAYILLGGNNVILKPSEFSIIVAPLIEDIFSEAKLLPEFINIIYGNGETGKWLSVQPEIKKIFFFGRQSNGMSVYHLCSQQFKPCVLEFGGGSTAVVCKNADLQLAASGITWSALYCNGQSCVGTNRVIVSGEVADEFIPLLKSKIKSFQLEQFAGIKSSEAAEPEQIIDITVSEDLNTAVGNINTLYPSLGASVWNRNRKEALSLADKINTKMIWINDTSFGLPCLPWGGINSAGLGSLFSESSIHEITGEKWISIDQGNSSGKIWWNPYTSLKEKLFRLIAKNF